jgi:cation:H+ antiporter
MVVVGLLLLLQGAGWMVDSATQFARWWGVSELVIGLTVVAVGTSLPEIATSLVAGLRGQRDIAVGNVVGSNIFNILLVIGLTATVAPGGLTVTASALRYDIPIMAAAAVVCLPVLYTRYMISRWEGGLFLGLYAAYTVFLMLRAVDHAALAGFSRVMLLGILPLTALLLTVAAVRQNLAARSSTRRDHASRDAEAED